MWRLKVLIPIFFWLAPSLFPTAGVRGEGLDFDGFVKIDKRFLVGDGVSNGDTYGKVRFEAKSELTEDLFSLVSLDLRYYDFPLLEDFPFVSEIESNYPVDLLLWEAYVELNQFIWDNLDVKIGKQRIAWGTADTFNPTDNLNPDDFTDFLDFGLNVPTLALKANYYFEDYTVMVAWLPVFEPALFPRGGTLSFLGQVPVDVEVPARTLDNGMFAAKLSGTAFNVDYSLSYFRGFDDIPIELRNVGGLTLGFPEIQVGGFDFAGEFRSVGFWGEVAMFFPEEIESGPRVILSDDPYVKSTFGADYTLKNGVYIQAQYVHGFFTERGKGELNDFLIATIERRLLNDDLMISMNGAMEAEDVENLRDSYGVGLFPEMEYRLVTNVKFTIGAFLFAGKRGTLFGRLKESDQVFFKTTVSF